MASQRTSSLGPFGKYSLLIGFSCGNASVAAEAELESAGATAVLGLGKTAGTPLVDAPCAPPTLAERHPSSHTIINHQKPD